LTEDSPLPASIETEQAVLGAVLMNNDAFDGVSQILRAEHFSEELHAMFWEAICELMAAGRMATPVNLAPSFRGLSIPADGGPVPASVYIANLASQAVTVVGALDYARTIVDLSHRRALISTARDLIEAATSSPISVRPSELATSAIENLDAVIVESAVRSARIHIGSAAARVIERLEAAARGEKTPIVSTGIGDLDRKLGGGFEPGELILLAGRPGMGKSAIALSVAMNVARAGGGVGFFSLEMTEDPLAMRALSTLCFHETHRIEYRTMRGGEVLNDAKLERLVDAQRLLERLPIIIEPQAGVTLAQIVQRARRMAGRMLVEGHELKLLIVDHLGLIRSTSKKNDSREREVALISMGLKQAAKDLGVPVLALAQLSRQVEGRKISDKRPGLSDLRESGSLEQDADTVIGLFRESYYLAQQNDEESAQRCQEVENDLEAILLKTRMGPNGMARLFCAIGSNYVCDHAALRGADAEAFQGSFV
jgi:replicative DNA helicase